MSAPHPVIASWADTGRAPKAPAPEPLKDFIVFFAELRAGRMPPPLLLRQYAAIADELVERLMQGERPNLHRMLHLPDRKWSEGRRRLQTVERGRAIRAVCAAFPGDLGPWQRAERFIELMHDRETPCPPGVLGELATLRAGLLGKVPGTARRISTILTDPPEMFARELVSENPPTVKGTP